MKIASWIAFAFFTYATVVQYNDPDAPIWMAQYGFAAVASFFYAIDIVQAVNLAWASVAIAVFQSGFYLKSIAQNSFMNTHPIEFASELGGTIIVLAWTIVLIKTAFFNRTHREEAT